MAGTCEEPTPATMVATAHFRFAGVDDFDFVRRLPVPDLLRLPSTERPPASIILVYSSWVDPVITAAICWKE
jgi:hypothetical protein